jgi:aminomethyltransferase
MVPFGGWEMPVRYTTIKKEHAAVRQQVGLFDVSHMGQFEFQGPNVMTFLNDLCANDASQLSIGQAQYSMLLNEQGGTIDDIIIYRLGEAQVLMVVNAGNIDKDWAHVEKQASNLTGVVVRNLSDDYALLAVQGPKAESLLNQIVDINVSRIEYYGVATAQVAGIDVLIARTGYTGEDGFELFVKAEKAAEVWDIVLAAGTKYQLEAVGLGARDTLRLEASMPLYGHELDENTSPLEAGLGYFVAKEGQYIGAARQRELRQKGLSRKLLMLKLTGRGIAREGYPVLDQDGNKIGHVTSGTMAPHLGYAIAQAYVDAAYRKIGTTVNIEIRGRPVSAKVVKRPFYKRKK